MSEAKTLDVIHFGEFNVTPIRLCVSCKYFTPATQFSAIEMHVSYATCANRQATRTNPVTGIIHQAYCESMRMTSIQCGPHGAWHEPRLEEAIKIGASLRGSDLGGV